MAGSKKTVSIEKQIADCEREIEKEIARWKQINEHGCNDPFWPDGVNMNLVRNHVVYYLTMIAELDRKPRQLSMFDTVDGRPDVLNDPRIPPKVNDSYMANGRKLLR